METLRLPAPSLFSLAEAALEAGLERASLLLGLPPLFKASLPRLRSPMDQQLSDLSRLNDTPALVGFDGHPLGLWLDNAERLTLAAGPRAAFAEARLALLAGVADAPAEAIDRLARSQSQAAKAGQPSLFLSYATADRAAVDPLYEALVARLGDPARVFQDHRSIAVGSKWYDVLYGALGSASMVAAWVTPALLQANYCKWELGLAEGRGARVVPIFTDPTAITGLPRYLSDAQGLRLDGPPDYGALADGLVAALDG